MHNTTRHSPGSGEKPGLSGAGSAIPHSVHTRAVDAGTAHLHRGNHDEVIDWPQSVKGALSGAGRRRLRAGKVADIHPSASFTITPGGPRLGHNSPGYFDVPARRVVEREGWTVMSNQSPLGVSRERVRVRTPMRCPICDSELNNVLVRDLGGVTANIIWQLHAGNCPDHGWFQTEVISRPPREIFPVTRPFGAARRIVIDGREHFAFSTVWNDIPAADRRRPVDPLDGQYWVAKRGS